MKPPILFILFFAAIAVYGQTKLIDTTKKPSVTELLSGKVAGLNIQQNIGVFGERGSIPIGGPNCKICEAKGLNKTYTYEASIYIFKVAGRYYKLTPEQAIELSLLNNDKHHLNLAKEAVVNGNCSIGEKLTCCFFEIRESEIHLQERLTKGFEKHKIRPISAKKAKEIENSVF